MSNLTFRLVTLLSAFVLGACGASVVGFTVISGPNSARCCAILQQQLPGKVSLTIQGLYENEYSTLELKHKPACRVNSPKDTEDVSTTLSVLVGQNCHFAVVSHEHGPSSIIPSIQSPRITFHTNATTQPDDIEESILAKYRSSRRQRRRHVAVYDHIDAYNLTAVLHGVVLSPSFQQKTASTKKFRFLMAPMRM